MFVSPNKSESPRYTVSYMLLVKFLSPSIPQLKEGIQKMETKSYRLTTNKITKNNLVMCILHCIL